MEIGIDSFAAFVTDAQGNPVGTAQDALQELLERIQLADEKGLDVFAIGEHHRKEFLDSATSVILAAAAARTQWCSFAGPRAAPPSPRREPSRRCW
jgi:alkanesulfonate monooxygenase SsuD/methylene tetrahydromethanopterin reductase-like flavin-dependent oxidoreductase (luciferase family)